MKVVKILIAMLALLPASIFASSPYAKKGSLFPVLKPKTTTIKSPVIDKTVQREQDQLLCPQIKPTIKQIKPNMPVFEVAVKRGIGFTQISIQLSAPNEEQEVELIGTAVCNIYEPKDELITPANQAKKLAQLGNSAASVKSGKFGTAKLFMHSAKKQYTQTLQNAALHALRANHCKDVSLTYHVVDIQIGQK